MTENEEEQGLKAIPLTPTEELVLEVLVARTRLGERIWPFDSKVSRQVMSLENKGFVHSMSGNVERSIRAYLTDEAFATYLSFDYVPPIAKKNPEMIPAFNEITKKAQELLTAYNSLGS